VARLDPRQQAERALRLNPRSELTRNLVRVLSSIDSPPVWEELARKARVPGR
jgi:hypothetical protein